jgi:hypothetical protein
VAYSGQRNRLWHNNGLGTFTDVSTTHLPSISDTTRAAVGADVDFDGDVDLFVANSGANRLFIGELDYKYADVTATNLPSGIARDTYDVIVADLDRDGYPDFMTANYNQQNGLLLNVGGGQFDDFTASLPPDQDDNRCICTADFDGDGVPDVLTCGNDVERIYINKTPAP